MTRPTRDDALDPAERTLAEALARATDARGPSLELDSRVLRAAREEAARRAQAPAATPHRSQRRRRNPAWLRGGALAATLVLAVGVAWQLRPQLDAPGREAGMAPEAADAGGQSFEKATPAGQFDGPDAARAAGAGAGPVDSATQTPSDPASADSAASTREVSARARRGLDASVRHMPAASQAAPAPARRMDPPPPAPPAPPPPPSPPAPPAPDSPAARAAAAQTRDAAATAAARAQAKVSADRQSTDAGRSAIEPTGAQLQRAEARRDRPEAAAIHFDATAAQGEAGPADQASEDWLDQPLDETPPASVDSPVVRDAWLARIRELVASERYEEARDSFAEFRRRHPTAPVPDDMRALLGAE